MDTRILPRPNGFTWSPTQDSRPPASVAWINALERRFYISTFLREYLTLAFFYQAPLTRRWR